MLSPSGDEFAPFGEGFGGTEIGSSVGISGGKVFFKLEGSSLGELLGS